MINFLFHIFLPPGASKFFFLDLTQYFQVWPKNVSIEMNSVNNVIYKNFQYNDQLSKIHCFLSRSH